MVLLVFQALAIVLQIVAMYVATKLTKATNYNASWAFFFIAIGLITLQRVDEFIASVTKLFDLNWNLYIPQALNLWSGVITSICVAFAFFFIRKLIIFIKISELRRAATQEKNLNAVIEAEERQRQLFAKELHDGLGPLLSTAQMSISAIKSSDELQQEIVENAKNAISLAIVSLKSTSGALSSHVLENFGLSRALNNIIKNIDPLKTLNIKFYTNIGSRRFVASHELVIYRCVSELLNNTLKHAKATDVTIDLVWTGRKFELVYCDNGVGFDPKAATVGMGLTNITSRAESVKGKINIVSSLGAGMKVSISFSSREL